jgi:hypothetical protein
MGGRKSANPLWSVMGYGYFLGHAIETGITFLFYYFFLHQNSLFEVI